MADKESNVEEEHFQHDMNLTKKSIPMALLTTASRSYIKRKRKQTVLNNSCLVAAITVQKAELNNAGVNLLDNKAKDLFVTTRIIGINGSSKSTNVHFNSTNPTWKDTFYYSLAKFSPDTAIYFTLCTSNNNISTIVASAIVTNPLHHIETVEQVNKPNNKQHNLSWSLQQEDYDFCGIQENDTTENVMYDDVQADKLCELDLMEETNGKIGTISVLFSLIKHNSKQQLRQEEQLFSFSCLLDDFKLKEFATNYEFEILTNSLISSKSKTSGESTERVKNYFNFDKLLHNKDNSHHSNDNNKNKNSNKAKNNSTDTTSTTNNNDNITTVAYNSIGKAKISNINDIITKLSKEKLCISDHLLFKVYKKGKEIANKLIKVSHLNNNTKKYTDIKLFVNENNNSFIKLKCKKIPVVASKNKLHNLLSILYCSERHFLTKLIEIKCHYIQRLYHLVKHAALKSYLNSFLQLIAIHEEFYSTIESFYKKKHIQHKLTINHIISLFNTLQNNYFFYYSYITFFSLEENAMKAFVIECKQNDEIKSLFQSKKCDVHSLLEAFHLPYKQLKNYKLFIQLICTNETIYYLTDYAAKNNTPFKFDNQIVDDKAQRKMLAIIDELIYLNSNTYTKDKNKQCNTVVQSTEGDITTTSDSEDILSSVLTSHISALDDNNHNHNENNNKNNNNIKSNNTSSKLVINSKSLNGMNLLASVINGCCLSQSVAQHSNTVIHDQYHSVIDNLALSPESKLIKYFNSETNKYKYKLIFKDLIDRRSGVIINKLPYINYCLLSANDAINWLQLFVCDTAKQAKKILLYFLQEELLLLLVNNHNYQTTTTNCLKDNCTYVVNHPKELNYFELQEDTKSDLISTILSFTLLPINNNNNNNNTNANINGDNNNSNNNVSETDSIISIISDTLQRMLDIYDSYHSFISSFGASAVCLLAYHHDWNNMTEDLKLLNAFNIDINDLLEHKEKLYSFFLNLTNLLQLHSLILVNHKFTITARDIKKISSSTTLTASNTVNSDFEVIKSMLKDRFNYKIGSFCFDSNNIINNVLLPTSNLSILPKPITTTDDTNQLYQTIANHFTSNTQHFTTQTKLISTLVLFAIYLPTMPCAPLEIYQPNDILNQLKRIIGIYLSNSINFKVARQRSKILLPTACKQYASLINLDVVAMLNKLLPFISNQDKRNQLDFILNDVIKKFDITYHKEIKCLAPPLTLARSRYTYCKQIVYTPTSSKTLLSAITEFTANMME